MGRGTRPELEQERLMKYNICKLILSGTIERVRPGEGVEISRGKGRSRVAVWKRYHGDRLRYETEMQDELLSVSRCLRSGQNLAVVVKNG